MSLAIVTLITWPMTPQQEIIRISIMMKPPFLPDRGGIKRLNVRFLLLLFSLPLILYLLLLICHIVLEFLLDFCTLFCKITVTDFFRVKIRC